MGSLIICLLEEEGGGSLAGLPPLIWVRLPDDVFVAGRVTAVSIRDRVFFSSNFKISAEVCAE